VQKEGGVIFGDFWTRTVTAYTGSALWWR